jgi:hypothetical protein
LRVYLRSDSSQKNPAAPGCTQEALPNSKAEI